MAGTPLGGVKLPLVQLPALSKKYKNPLLKIINQLNERESYVKR